MNDIGWVLVPKSDQLNAEMLNEGPLTIKITEVIAKKNQEQPITIRFEGDAGKPYKPCKTMCKVLANVYSRDANLWIGHSLTLWNDTNVKYGKIQTGGIRISHMSGIDEKRNIPYIETKGRVSIHTVQPLNFAKTDTKPAPQGEQPKKTYWETLRDRTESAQTLEAIETIANMKSVVTIMTEGSEEHKSWATDLLEKARTRLASLDKEVTDILAENDVPPHQDRDEAPGMGT